MATYAELTAQYEALEQGGGDKWRFRQAHPKWWENYQRAQSARPDSGYTGPGEPASGGPGAPPPSGGGGGGYTEPGSPASGGPAAGSGGATGPEEEEEETEERPERPTSPLPEGWTWEWDDDAQAWVPRQGEPVVDVVAQGRLRAELREILDQFGLATPGNIELIERAVREDWSPTKFVQEMRQSPDYLANPLFAANLERAKAGNRFMLEGEVIAYATQARQLARRWGYQEPSDNYIAEGIRSGLSMAEIEHRFSVQDRVNQFGVGVGLAYREILGRDPTDQDLFEIFDPEISTDEIDDALRQAEYRGRPFTLGLGIRTEAEARALEMLGVKPDEAFSRYQGVAQNAPRFERLRTIEDMITQGLPSNFGEHLSTAENGILIRALVFQDPAALAQLQDITAREIARFRTGAGVQAQQGQLTGLLSPTERQSYG